MTWRAGRFLALTAALGCGTPERAPAQAQRDLAGTGLLIPDEGDGSTGGDVVEPPSVLDPDVVDAPPPIDESNLCGDDVLEPVDKRPNLYFVLDRSNSMSDTLEGDSRYNQAYATIVALLKLVGHRVRYGAAVYPGTGSDCAPGLEVFATQEGDGPEWAAAGRTGPVLSDLQWQLSLRQPTGGTPLSSTLEKLTPELLALEGTTYVFLATDGGPNCNAAARCGADTCGWTNSGYSLDGISCSAELNCCSPSVYPDGPLACVDGDASLEAVERLRDAGIVTFVIGIGGDYLSVLDELAVAGGAPREVTDERDPRYYQASDAKALESVLLDLGLAVALSCDVPLAAAPPDPNLVNVYFDGEVVPSDDVEGWRWRDDRTVELVGAYCESLQSGAVLQVRVVAGCPTELR